MRDAMIIPGQEPPRILFALCFFFLVSSVLLALFQPSQVPTHFLFSFPKLVFFSFQKNTPFAACSPSPQFLYKTHPPSFSFLSWSSFSSCLSAPPTMTYNSLSPKTPQAIFEYSYTCHLLIVSRKCLFPAHSLPHLL